MASMKARVVAVLGAVVVSASVGGAAYAAAKPAAAPPKITVCAAKGNKVLRLVSPTTRKCAKGETLVTWNVQGARGLRGPAGARGDDGGYGMSAYEIAADEGYTGTPQDWLESLKGDTGAQGPQGPRGFTGAPGSDGAAGPKGDKGDKGDAGTGATVTQLPVGDEDCPNGGAKIEDGAGHVALVCGASVPT